MPRWTTGPWTESERQLIGKYPTLTARQIQVIFEKKGFIRSIHAISDARTRFGHKSHSEQSKRRNSDARSVFNDKDIEVIQNFDFSTRYHKTPCLKCQLRDENKDNYTCTNCQPRHHYAMQSHTKWGEDYGQATREIWDTMQYAFTDSNLSVYVGG